MVSEISEMSDSSIVIIQDTVGLYTVATRCHRCFAVTLKYREGAATAGNDFRPPVSSQPVLVLNANYISRFLTYLTPPKT